MLTFSFSWSFESRFITSFAGMPIKLSESDFLKSSSFFAREARAVKIGLNLLAVILPYDIVSVNLSSTLGLWPLNSEKSNPVGIIFMEL